MLLLLPSLFLLWLLSLFRLPALKVPSSTSVRFTHFVHWCCPLKRLRTDAR